MTNEEKAQLRLMLAEEIPVGGSETDTMFSDAQLETIFATAGSDLTAAALGGWRLKAAQYAELVDVSEVGEQLRLSQLHEAALKMAEHFENLSSRSARGSRNHPLSRTYRR